MSGARVPSLSDTSSAGLLRWANALASTVQKMLDRLAIDGQLSRMRSYVKADLPDAAGPARLILVVDETGGAVPAFNDGSSWRRVTDRAVVS